jgi:sugar-specific transcriptional regulator TrmB
MMHEELAESLVKFGITHNQARVYLAALKLGETSIEPISKLSKVRREDVYRALPRLYELGIVHHLLGSPLRVRAAPLDEATNILLQVKREGMISELEDLVNTSDAIIDNYLDDRETLVDEHASNPFEMMEGKVAIKMKSVEIARSFRRSMSAFLSERHLVSLIDNNALSSENIDTGRRIMLIISHPSEYYAPLIQEWKDTVRDAVDIRYANDMGTFFGVYDNEQALICLPGEEKNKMSLICHNIKFIEFLNKNFDLLWESAELTSRY